jgi:ADP-heptose:LPS heptosyltransferase
MSRSKAFFINGGAGRVVCSIPAFELYEKESGDKDFIIVCEGGTDLFKGHPTLDDRTYDTWHKNLFKEKIKDKDVVSPEPYRVWEYYNQQCNLSQAFDIEINGKGIRELPKPNVFLSKEELLAGRQLVSEVKKTLKKEKTIVFQPFGRGIQYIDESFVDPSSRSIEYKDVKVLIRKLQEKGFAVIMMSELKLDLREEKYKDDVASPENIGLRQWAAIIKYADHFLGCDSVGQHLAYSMKTPTTVVFGSTFPINVSYPDELTFNILDMGEDTREYSPIRIIQDERVDRKHEHIMTMSKEIQDYVVDAILGKNKDE